ncbi:PH domain-containing protein [Pseudogracilibacillus sp. ICA-222130]|uniref:PH domain-containing protein n=1 Tax=Pseudogracilibacillus sp. ICA-222130 TaxID=3134655 RepID=UPI0030BDB1AC
MKQTPDTNNDVNFTSKKDGWFALFIWGTIIFMCFLMIIDRSMIVYIFGLLMNMFLLWIWFGTNYKVTEEQLYIVSGPFRTTIHIANIRKIKATKSLLSAPALSVDRMEIHYNTYDMVIVSPKEKDAFIRNLQSKNKSIEVEKK